MQILPLSIYGYGWNRYGKDSHWAAEMVFWIYLGVTYKTAWLMLHKIRSNGERDAQYTLAGIWTRTLMPVKIDDKDIELYTPFKRVNDGGRLFTRSQAGVHGPVSKIRMYTKRLWDRVACPGQRSLTDPTKTLITGQRANYGWTLRNVYICAGFENQDLSNEWVQGNTR
jgi:hypothetical protein